MTAPGMAAWQVRFMVTGQADLTVSVEAPNVHHAFNAAWETVLATHPDQADLIMGWNEIGPGVLSTGHQPAPQLGDALDPVWDHCGMCGGDRLFIRAYAGAPQRCAECDQTGDAR